jgi:hypothetical protein
MPRRRIAVSRSAGSTSRASSCRASSPDCRP